MDAINNPMTSTSASASPGVRSRKTFCVSNYHKSCLKMGDRDSLQISKDSDVSKELRAPYSDLIYRLRWRVPDQADPAAPERADPAAPEQPSAQGARHPVAPSPSAGQGEAAQATGDQADVAALDPADAAATLDPAAAPATLALHVYILFEHKRHPDDWVLLQRLRDIALQGEAYRKQHPEAKTRPQH